MLMDCKSLTQLMEAVTAETVGVLQVSNLQVAMLDVLQSAQGRSCQPTGNSLCWGIVW
jgi:hypothetical protein